MGSHGTYYRGPGSDEIRLRHFSSGDFSTAVRPASAGIPLEPAMTSMPDFSWDLLGQNWGFVEGFFQKFIHGCEITTCSGLGGMVTMSVFRARNSWSCFVGQSVAKFSLRLWVTRLAAWIISYTSTQICVLKSPLQTPKFNSSALKNGAWKTIDLPIGFW